MGEGVYWKVWKSMCLVLSIHPCSGLNITVADEPVNVTMLIGICLVLVVVGTTFVIIVVLYLKLKTKQVIIDNKKGTINPCYGETETGDTPFKILMIQPSMYVINLINCVNVMVKYTIDLSNTHLMVYH